MNKTFQRNTGLMERRKRSLIEKDNVDNYGFAIRVEN